MAESSSARAPAGAPPGIIVVGMHRSSTSLVTSAFVACGYHLAPDQLPPADDNPKGYFEDRQMHTLHRRMLEAYDTAWDLGPRLRELRRQELVIPADLQAEAQEIVDYYRSQGPWVWKNPRATLFLDEWARWFPEATFVICVREPAAVVDSMLRRKDRMRISSNRKFYRARRLARGLSVWHSYNLVAYRFARRHPDRAVVVRVPEDLPALQHACGVAVLEPGMLKRPRRRTTVPASVALSSRLLYLRLARLADPARIAALLQDQRAARRDEGRIGLRPLLRVAGSMAASLLLDVGYNVAF